MKVRHIDFYADEFLGGVTNFSAQDIGVYWVACSIMYADGGPITENHPRFRVIKIRQTDLKASLGRLVAAGKLTRTGSGLVQKRVQEELERASTRIRRSSENGAKGGRPPKENNDLGKPAGLPLGSGADNPAENPNTNYQLPTSNAGEAPPQNVDDAVYRCCVEAGCREDVRGTDTIRLVRWMKLYDLERFILPAIRRKRAAMEAAGEPPPQSLKFFDNILPDVATAQARAQAAKSPSTPPRPAKRQLADVMAADQERPIASPN